MKLLVIGYGSIGRRHAKNFSQHVEVAVYDQNIGLLNQNEFQTFDSLEAALAWQPAVVVVSTPHHTHLEIATQALQSGADVLIEKPISHALDGVNQLIEQADIQQKKCHVVCNMRFHSAVATLKQNLFRIGQPLFVRAHYGDYLPTMRPHVDYRNLYAANREQGGGVILDAIHEIDYLQWIFGAVQSVNAEAAKLSDLDINVEDYAAICLHHQNGVRSEIHLDYLQRCRQRGCEIVGDQGTLIWRSINKMPEQCRVDFYSTEDKQWQTLYYCEDEPPNQPYEYLVEHYLNALSHDNNDLATAEDGLNALKTALAALSSAKSGRRVEPS